MTEKQKKELSMLIQEKERREIGTNYKRYIHYINRGLYKGTRHGDYICDRIQEAINKKKAMLKGEIPEARQYLMFSMPPQHTKSYTITEALPSFFEGNFPDEGSIVLCYNSSFASQFGEKNRDKVIEYGGWLWGLSVAKGSTSKTDWTVSGVDRKTKRRGKVISAGIQGGITGRSQGDLIIIDDPIKNKEEAMSKNTKDKIWGEWISTITTRVHPTSIIIIIMTRWHEDDLCGRLLNPEYGEPFNWQVYNLPLEAEEDDLLGRKIGEPLWPEKFGYDFIAERKKYPDSFYALYQGRPVIEGGNIIKKEWWNFYDELPQGMTKILSVDATFKGTDTSDRVSIQVWGKLGTNVYLIDNNTARMGFLGTLQAIKNMIDKHPDIGAKLIEDKANGSAIIEMLRRNVSGIIPVKADVSTGGKVARVQAVTPFIEGGNCFLPRNANWLQDFIYECSAFPNGKNDDCVDSMSQALNKLMSVYAPHQGLPEVNNRFFETNDRNDNEVYLPYDIDLGGW